MERARLLNTNGKRRNAAVVAIVGRSGTGKTSLLELMVPRLRLRGLAVGVVKHASHGFAADQPGKDSHRLYEAGAGAVALISHAQVATFVRRESPRAAEVCLDEALETLPPRLDVVLAEGFSWETLPRIVLVREGESPEPAHLENGEVIEIVSVPPPTSNAPPVFPERRVESLTLAVIRRLAERTSSRDGSITLPSTVPA